MMGKKLKKYKNIFFICLFIVLLSFIFLPTLSFSSAYAKELKTKNFHKSYCEVTIEISPLYFKKFNKGKGRIAKEIKSIKRFANFEDECKVFILSNNNLHKNKALANIKIYGEL